MTIPVRPDLSVLGNPAWASLTGPHAAFAERKGRVLRYPADVSPFFALPDDAGPADWADLVALVGPGEPVPIAAFGVEPPAEWEVLFTGEGVQMTGDEVPDGSGLLVAQGGTGEFPAAPGEHWAVLGAADVPDVLALVERTKPGPFLPRTIELGTYVGVRVDGRLVAMAGERLHPPGWTEISAVCTDTDQRGRGLATRLVLAAVARIRSRGEQPFLHAAADNTNAIRLYAALGFRLNRRTTFTVVRTPGN
ncbi:GNAT family N-acetyltransferase [Yinghuangia seranimata]|uniref:GNAT family N-acetyltransferase n=1 Tax=Yinghuangia seranimata TaxID=408067 RepID=UPI00248C165F|nr:GNAT family N-acetyltransferase [Yinghuangia seranimata]MDI2128517.1 GNAT family N-acetyltransferase [Yinghuangia seranimata]